MRTGRTRREIHHRGHRGSPRMEEIGLFLTLLCEPLCPLWLLHQVDRINFEVNGAQVNIASRRIGERHVYHFAQARAAA
jgi:hypothetical protein